MKDSIFIPNNKFYVRGIEFDGSYKIFDNMDGIVQSVPPDKIDVYAKLLGFDKEVHQLDIEFYRDGKENMDKVDDIIHTCVEKDFCFVKIVTITQQSYLHATMVDYPYLTSDKGRIFYEIDDLDRCLYLYTRADILVIKNTFFSNRFAYFLEDQVIINKNKIQGL